MYSHFNAVGLESLGTLWNAVESFVSSLTPSPSCLCSGKPMEVLARKQVAASLAAVRTAGGGNNAPQGRLKFTFLLALDPSGGSLSQTPLDPSEVQAGRYYQWRLHKIQSALSAIGAVQPAAEANRSSSVGHQQQQRNKCENQALSFTLLSCSCTHALLNDHNAS